MINYTFNLKEPNSKSDTLIFLRARFPLEAKYLKYSTGEVINPKFWDAQNKMPLTLKGRSSQAVRNREILTQLLRYKTEFEKSISEAEMHGLDLSIDYVKKRLDKAFKKTNSTKQFFDYYDEFVMEKKMNRDWSPATSKRYYNIKSILRNFENSRKYKLNFASINGTFHSKFTDYCMGDLKHINNTYARNLGLIKSFMFWAYERNYTYNDEFKKFKKKKRVITNQVVINKEDLQKLLAIHS